MATFNPIYTVGTTLHASESVANAASEQDDLNLRTASGGPFFKVWVWVEFAISSGSPAGNLVIELLESVDDGSNFSTIAYQTFAIPFSSTGTKSMTFPIDGPCTRVKVTNSTGVTGTYQSKYASLEQSST